MIWITNNQCLTFNTGPTLVWGPALKQNCLYPSIYFLFLSCHGYILSLHHVVGHVGNITGEILSTINSPSPYWLTHQHSSPLAEHSPSVLADRQGCGLCWH